MLARINGQRGALLAPWRRSHRWLNRQQIAEIAWARAVVRAYADAGALPAVCWIADDGISKIRDPEPSWIARMACDRLATDWLWGCTMMMRWRRPRTKSACYVLASHFWRCPDWLLSHWNPGAGEGIRTLDPNLGKVAP